MGRSQSPGHRYRSPLLTWTWVPSTDTRSVRPATANLRRADSHLHAASWEHACCMPVGADGRYECPDGFHLVRLYPVEGESAIAELWFDDAPWAQITLDGVEQGAVGDARVANVRFVVSLFPPPPGTVREWWEFDLADVENEVATAKEWLVENERHRVAVQGDGLTAAGSAFEKIGIDDPRCKGADDHE